MEDTDWKAHPPDHLRFHGHPTIFYKVDLLRFFALGKDGDAVIVLLTPSQASDLFPLFITQSLKISTWEIAQKLS